VTGVDARTERMPADPAIRWVQSDVRDFEFGPADFDVVSLLGLLYHLDRTSQTELLKKCADILTILDTHVAGEVNVIDGGYGGG
jgi:2-polyprenyl-3-methyl-5-hydroxy-6-metoxy-1,4-benzoquinol methylase